MPCIEYLIATDRIVLAGLTAYDQATQRAIDEHRRLLEGLGHTPEEIAEAERDHLDRIRTGRGKLHRELWTRALAMSATDAPDAGTPPLAAGSTFSEIER